jgi:hypothetical protein
MSAQLDSQVHIKWIVAPELEDEWQYAGGCVAPHQPADPQPLVADDEDDWWPGRCIP